MKILKLSDSDYKLLLKAINHAGCYMHELATHIARDERMQSYAHDQLCNYIELGIAIEDQGAYQ